MVEYYIEDKRGRQLVIEHSVSEGYEDVSAKLFWGPVGRKGTAIGGPRAREEALELLAQAHPAHEARIVEPEPAPEPEIEAWHGRVKAAVVRYVRPKPAVLCPKCGAADPKIKKKEGEKRLHWCECGERFWSYEE